MQDTGRTAYELERTYLARAIPAGLRAATRVEIADFYFPSNNGLPRLRARQQGGEYMLTLKDELESPAQHIEKSIFLDPTEFRAICTGASGHLRKLRYLTVLAHRLAHVDVFRAALEGLVLIEFEFDNWADIQSFIPPPDTCLADVTLEPFAAGGNLAGRTLSDLQPELARFAYRPLWTSHASLDL